MGKTSLDKGKIKFLLLEGIHPSAVDVLRQAGYDNVETVSSALQGDELKEKLADVHFLGIRSRTQLTADALAAANKLVAVGAFCIGTNQIDLQAARQKGVAVFNAPYSNTRSVAELVLGELILLLRGIPQKNAVAHRGGWLKSATNSYETRGKTLGIVGYGSIGSQLSVLAESLGMHVIFYDAITKLPLGNAQQVGSLKELLERSDVVTLHVPELPSTKWMIGAKELAAMKDGAILINASRGTVVEIEPLAEALRSKKLLGAAIDVFPVEPKSNQDEFVSPLRGMDNVIITPHIGGSTMEAQANIGLEVAEKLVRYSDNGTTTTSVNFPEAALPAHAGRDRILHIHKNVPGVMSAINQIFSDAQLNVAAQYLQTDEAIGYVVIDTEPGGASKVLEPLRRVPGTIRARVLF
ncbi:phosphoglycerate dehydrogenase [Vandammella animalimorsus]|uniref:2-oxoglutarate reductase n=1 Tax=Vandammella animalimorsus TaxID=2029117 RepID=A0A2A2ASW2_9BURK|nr:phosphoglycerate dehydrogenase [Vandammella animalimorsus]RRD68636.1 phosphoglycerate dehydrogenase [Comamonadaceae bacterium OH2310_COT-174]PAT31546.1 D-3-phosphoglycerate dehydrogenase [Vandammella animalimorsus]PAT35822.1 D-3-phosphoglycerate dehydrogenase [Vandammella animalimorsus]PAT40784.1 D-3-phosphoglycerate dehydrogenase [Vandammella animalimorsus]PAX18618.1 phosphoglycerate dehydrogenase [Vandammella animalimorsus]